MNKRALLISTRSAFGGAESGGGLRSIQVERFLKNLNFDVIHVSSSNLVVREHFDLICVVSFANAHLLNELKNYCNFLWFDATDSWRVTRKSLFLQEPSKEILRLIRDAIYSRAYRAANLITFCTLRDLEAEKLRSANVFVLPNKYEPEKINQDYGFRFVFAGPFSYLPNKKAIDFLVKTMGTRDFESTRLHVYSGMKMDYPRTENVSFESSQPFRKLYGISDIHLVPIEHGAGMKFKTLIPLSLGIKVISTPEGAVGLLPNSNLQLATNLNNFVELMHHSYLAYSPVRREPILPDKLAYEVDDSMVISRFIDTMITIPNR